MIPIRIRRISSCLKKMKGKKTSGSETAGKNRGFSLVELLIAISVLAAVSAMLLQLLSTAASSYRKTIFTSQLQKSSQMISRRVETAIMNARSLYYQKDSAGNAFLYMGNNVPGQEQTSFQGALIWFDAETGTVYYCDQIAVGAADTGKLTTAAVKTAVEGENASNREYLLSTNVSGLVFELPSYMKDCRQQNSDSTNLAYTTDHRPAVTYRLSLRHISGLTYTISNSAVPRNRLKGIWWPTEAIAEEPTETTEGEPTEETMAKSE